MKIFLTTIFISLLLAQKVKGQEYYINNILDTYYPLNPFDYDFSFFLNKLRSDPKATDKLLKRRTDSTLFSFNGDYINFQQGETKFTNATIRLEEIELPISDASGNIDSLHLSDTLIQYQVTCYCFGGKNGLGVAKKAFTNFNRDYKVGFTQGITKELKEKEIVTGEVINYFSYNLPVSPLTVAWNKLNEDESIFVIMVRLKLKQNQLVIYKPADVKHPG
jgi:hypothetical protein